MSVKIQVFGTKETKKFLNSKKLKTNVNIKTAMIKAGALMESEVKDSIAGRKAEPRSVDTGNFMRSVEFQATKDNAVIFSNVPYADFLEFGTSRMKARRHFNNSKDRNKGKIKDIVENEVKKI